MTEDNLRIIEIAAQKYPQNIASPWILSLVSEVRRLQKEVASLKFGQPQTFRVKPKPSRLSEPYIPEEGGMRR